MVVWKLNKGADRRIRGGHPWIFSNELSVSPKGLRPGTPVLLRDTKGQFLAYGYGNPNSLISFRALSYNVEDRDASHSEFIVRKVLKAWWVRKALGYGGSFRMVYGEGDYLPGLVIDLYHIEQNGKRGQVLAAQILSAGMEELLRDLELFFKNLVEDGVEQKLSEYTWEQTAVVIRNDVNVRKLEGLEYQEAKLLKSIEGIDLTDIDILLDPPKAGDDLIPMATNLVDGQKTGFFLDQAHNIQAICDVLERIDVDDGILRILDLCCYVGQWSTKITSVLKRRGIKVEVTAVDVSDQALAFAKKNIDRQGAVTIIRKLDVLRDLGALPDRHFDVVIADPPAFIKAKKDVPTGRHAYLKLNTAAFKLVKRGGLVVSCSCSGLFAESELIETLSKAARRGETEPRCLLKGGHGPDHPVLMSFSEGFYLKMFLHHVI